MPVLAGGAVPFGLLGRFLNRPSQFLRGQKAKRQGCLLADAPKEGLPGGLRCCSRLSVCPTMVTAALCCHLLSSASGDLRNRKRHRREGEYSIKANVRVGGDGAGCAAASVHTARTAPNPKAGLFPGFLSPSQGGSQVSLLGFLWLPSTQHIPHCCCRIPFLNPPPHFSETTGHVCPAFRAECIPKVR